jgi:hypothetical protein
VGTLDQLTQQIVQLKAGEVRESQRHVSHLGCPGVESFGPDAVGRWWCA